MIICVIPECSIEYRRVTTRLWLLEKRMIMFELLKNKEVEFQDLDNDVSRKVLVHNEKILMAGVYLKIREIGTVHAYPHQQTS